MFETTSKVAFASYSYFQKITAAGYDGEHIEELWEPDASQKKALIDAKFKCSQCGLQSKPGLMPTSNPEIPSRLSPGIAVFNDYIKSQEGKLRLPAGFMDICTKDNRSRILCWVCRTAESPSLSVSGIKAHGIAVYLPSISQAKISQLAISHAFAKKTNDDALAVGAENAMYAIRQTLVPQVDRVIPGLTNGSIEQLVSTYNALPKAVHEDPAKYLGDVKYIPNEPTYSMHMAYWFGNLKAHPSLKARTDG